MRRDSTDTEARLWRMLRDRGCGVKFRRRGGQHFEAETEARDRERTGMLEKSGLRVLRFTNREVLLEADAVVDSIREAVEGS